MKKLLAVALLICSGLAHAGSFIVEGSHANVSNRPDSEGYLIQVSEQVAKNLDASAQMLVTQADKTNAVTSRYEFGLTPRYDLGFGTFYTKFAVGQRLSSTGNREYYGIEPGIVIPFAKDWDFRLGYRMRDGFNGSVNERTNTTRIGLAYELTKNDILSIRYDYQRGDLEQNSWNFAYIRRF
jgi:hypothetical protein